MELFPENSQSQLFFEDMARRRGYRAVAGIDEAGRGPLAGPVVAAAVILPEDFDLPGLNDSKLISERKRNQLFPMIYEQALAIGIGVSRADEIDRINILQATLRGMSRAVMRLPVAADFLLVDGITPVPLGIEQKTLKKGDSRSLSIAAASVIAKVVRDRIMLAYDRLFPEYGFSGHKGYGSVKHRNAVALHGPCVCHRRSFAGVKEHCEAHD
ncbi:MAG: ribonuclease HII [Deltaproteobacteria bacterium]|jgi:ribonuclease HII|nr:ribonuclease HII [Deltaproteobacteria bacterium]MBW2511767.1 ribonuclease HII [Deltaproteobacteria bacterium]